MGKWLRFAATWLTLFCLLGTALLVFITWLWPFEDLQGVSGDTAVFRVLVRRDTDYGPLLEVPNMRDVPQAGPRACGMPAGALVTETTRGRQRFKSGPATCYYEILAAAGAARVVRLECGMHEFFYEVSGGCAAPLQRKLMGPVQMVIAGVIAALLAALITRALRRFL